MTVRRIPRRPDTDDPRWTSEVEPAPGELRIVQAFVNSAGPWTKTEELTSPKVLARWLLRWRLVSEEVCRDPAELTDADLDRAVALREGMRAMLRANNGGKLAEKAVTAFDRAAAEVPLRLRVDGAEGAPYLTAASGGVAGLGRLLGLFAAARLSESWIRFKACADGRCGAAFYDDSRGLLRKWCSARCANRFAARGYRRRRGIRPRGKAR
ncbi:MAG: CGNR zinc finger domain-containing protein [Thermoanaerobaculia bacterium]